LGYLKLGYLDEGVTNRIMDNLQVHYTITERIQGENGYGWEFTCKECSYRARYVHFPKHGKQTLEIIDIGDPTARHTNNAHKEILGEGSQAQDAVPGFFEDEAAWLTPELRAQIEAVLGKFNWD
jgi:hypothetical protein